MIPVVLKKNEIINRQTVCVEFVSFIKDKIQDFTKKHCHRKICKFDGKNSWTKFTAGSK